MYRPKVADALSYLDQVKARFSSQNEIYTDFLDVMRQFKAQTIGTDVVIRRVRELFEGHQDLIVGFNTFIPQGYRMDSPVSCSRPTGVTLPAVGQTYSTDVSPGKLPSFSAFRQSDALSQDVNPSTSSSALTYQSVSQSTEPSPFYSNPSNQPPVLRSHLTTTDTQQQSYHSLSVPNTQPVIEGQVVYPSALQSSQQQQPYVPNVQQHNAQSFNHAIIYVNKVKNRFQAKPDVYKCFLEILQWYQREQDHTDPNHRKQAELQVYQDVAKLLQGHEDLLQEFSRFLPESTGVASDMHDPAAIRNSQYCSVSELSSAIHNRFSANSSGLPPDNGASWHRSPSESMGTTESKKLKRVVPSCSSVVPSYSQGDSIPTKKPRHAFRDVSLSDIGGGVSGSDALLLQKISNVLDAEGINGTRSYQSLLQNISLFNRKLINEKQLIETAKLILQRHPELSRQFCDLFSGLQSDSHFDETAARTPDRESALTSVGGVQEEENKRYPPSSSITSPSLSDVAAATTGGNSVHPLTGADMVALVSEVSQKRLDLDFNKLRTCGASYRALPSDFPQPKCSGRLKSSIARSVLNDTYISFSSLTSEDSQFVSSKKNQYEENMYHTEDERYEADMVMELNRAALQNLIVVRRRLERMGRDELQNYKLDDYLGGTSAILMRKAIHRVYGDKAGDVIYGLKTCPSSVVPIVIQRMHQKDTEWREAVRKFQQFWSDQDSKNYLRSLDHQGTNFKQRDNAFIRPKTVVNHIENIARGENSLSSEPASGDVVGSMIAKCLTSCQSTTSSVCPATLGSALSHVFEGVGDDGGMHLTLEYPPPETCASLLQDVASLIIHHVKRQSNTSKEDKRTMKFLVRAVLQDFLMQERFPMSDDEVEEEECIDNDEEIVGGSDNDPSETGDSETMVGAAESTSNGSSRQLRRTRHYHRNVKSQEQSNGLDETSPMSSDRAEMKMKKRSKRKALSTSLDNTSHQENTLGLSSVQYPIEVSPKVPAEEYYCVLNGNNHWYAFLRLHHLLLTRLSQLRARAHLLQQEYDLENGKSHIQVSDVLRLRKKGHSEPREHYAMALQLVKDLLDGCEDVHTYEDRLRDMFGIYAYPWFTMDRLITNLVRQLHVLASGDELSHRLTSLFRCHFRSPGGRSRSDSTTVENGEETFSPAINGICGPLRTRYARLKDEARYQQAAFAACLDTAAAASNDDNGGSSNTNSGGAQPTFPPRSQLPNCYTLVMLRQASKLLIRLLDPTHIVTTCLAAHQTSAMAPIYPSPSLSARPPSPFEEARAANALKRAEEGERQVRHWYDYLARYLLIPGCWTAGPVSAALVARVRPVFLYRNVRLCVNKLTFQAVQRRKKQIVETSDPQPEEVLMHSLPQVQSNEETPRQVAEFTDTCEMSVEGAEPQREAAATDREVTATGNLEKDTWEVMVRVLRNSLTRSELFRDTFSSDCMQSSKILKSGISAPKTAYKINWSVGSYGIFIRTKKHRCQQSSTKSRSAEKFREFQARWIWEHGDQAQVAAVTAQLQRKGDPKGDTEPLIEGPDKIPERPLGSMKKEPFDPFVMANTPEGSQSVSRVIPPVEDPSSVVEGVSTEPEPCVTMKAEDTSV